MNTEIKEIIKALSYDLTVEEIAAVEEITVDEVNAIKEQYAAEVECLKKYHAEMEG